MNKKGFTLVELLAVIAILAILVIIALPNVLGMFTSAKESTFRVEVQNIMDAAKNAFITDQLNLNGTGTCYDSSTAGKSLALEGNSKDYYVKLDRLGNITTIFVQDNDFILNKTDDAGIAKTDIKGLEFDETPAGTVTQDGFHTVPINGKFTAGLSTCD